MRRNLSRIGLGLASLILMTTPGDAQVTDLMLSKSGDNVVLEWTTGTSPHRVLRSLSPAFISGNALVADGVTTGTATDAGALLEFESYFYQVRDANEPNPPLYDLNPPRPVPAITMLTPRIGGPGTSVTIDGVNFAAFGSGQTVMFGSEIGDVQSSTETQIVVTAPPGTVTDDVVVCVVDQCSNGVRFTVTVGPTFQDISSLAFEPGTGSLWLGDRGTADDVIEIDSSGTVFIRAGLGEAFIGNPSPGDGNGRVYFSNGTVSDFNQGTIRYIDSSDNSNVFFRAAGEGGGVDPVWARGLAARDDQPDVVYFLDGNNNTVRRVPEFGLIDFNWGNTALSFNNPAGGRFDSDSNLYVSSTTSIFKIAPDETVTLVASGFTGAAGIDLSEASGIPTLLVADKAAGEVWLVNGEDGERTLVGSGFANPVAVAFSEDITTGDLFYDVAEPTRIIRLPDPVIRFAIKKKQNTPVLIHKYRSDDAYPSSFQTEDGKIVVEATVIDGGPAAGIPIYFRLVDPKDTAPYASTGAGDNKGGLGTIDCGAGPATSCMTTSDASGKVSVELTVTDTYAGDNYRIEASFTPDPNFKVKAKSSTFTAWKRAYVEYDQMYKVGEFLNQPSGAGQPVGMPDATKVFVANPSVFAPGDIVHVFSGLSGSPGGGTEATLKGEMRRVASVVTTPPTHIVVEAIPPNTTDALQHTYPYSGGAPPGDDPPYSFVAKVAAGVYDIAATALKLAPVFDDAFVEFVFVEDALGIDGTGRVPAWTSIAEVDDIGRSALFFANRMPPSFATPKTNHVQLVASATHMDMDPDEMDAIGATLSGFNLSWVFYDKIASVPACGAAVLANCVLSTSAHELVHQWDVNPNLAGGHDSQIAHNSATRGCLMNLTSDDTLPDLARLHDNLTAPPPPPSIDLYCLRGHADDLNQTACSWPPLFP